MAPTQLAGSFLGTRDGGRQHGQISMGRRDSLVGGRGQDHPIPSLVEGAAAGPGRKAVGGCMALGAPGLGWARLHRGQERSLLPRSTGAPPGRSPRVSGEDAQVHKRHVPCRMCAGAQNPHECSQHAAFLGERCPARARVCVRVPCGVGAGTSAGLLRGAERVALFAEAGVGARQVLALSLPAGA